MRFQRRKAWNVFCETLIWPAGPVAPGQRTTPSRITLAPRERPRRGCSPLLQHRLEVDQVTRLVAAGCGGGQFGRGVLGRLFATLAKVGKGWIVAVGGEGGDWVSTLTGLTFLDQGQSWSGSNEVGLSVARCPSLAEGGRSPTGAKDGVSWAAKQAGLW